ncbi:MAG: 2-phospho-L-lactate transferase [Gammaproteobacteria bacterium]|nr:MAG: 2-phospho-L-lactate transferase [Gammaproteobacteria bacterium]
MPKQVHSDSQTNQNSTQSTPSFQSEFKPEAESIYLALSGGVGGAKLALGLHQLLSEKLHIMANTSDDFRHLGLNICPDLDTVMYTLATLNNKELGWGLAGETWQFMDALEQLNQPQWFRLGDRDLATHVTRTDGLNQGQSLSQVTQQLTQALGINATLFPMTEQTVSTFVRLKDGTPLAFQEYFVKQQCQPEISGYYFQGVDAARPSQGFLDCIEDRNLAAIILCPSNPFVSIEPILSVPGIAQALAKHPAPVIAVSPIIAGQAVKGPTAKMMTELNMPLSALGVAEFYQKQHPGLLDGFIIDHQDQALQPALEDLGIAILTSNTLMNTLQDRVTLAEQCLSFAAKLTHEHSSL